MDAAGLRWHPFFYGVGGGGYALCFDRLIPLRLLVLFDRNAFKRKIPVAAYSGLLLLKIWLKGLLDSFAVFTPTH